MPIPYGDGNEKTGIKIPLLLFIIKPPSDSFPPENTIYILPHLCDYNKTNHQVEGRYAPKAEGMEYFSLISPAVAAKQPFSPALAGDRSSTQTA